MLSIIIPFYNPGKFLDIFISMLLRLEPNPKLNSELIFINNNSSETGLNKYILFKLQGKFTCQVVDYSQSQSSYGARNFGVAHAIGDVLHFTDIDCILPENFLFQIERSIKNQFPNKFFYTVGAVDLHPINLNNTFDLYDYYAFLNIDEYASTGSGATANLLINKPYFELLDGFRTITSGGDIEFTKKAFAAGGNFIYDKALLVLHPPRSTKAEHIKKIKEYLLVNIKSLKHMILSPEAFIF